MSLEFDSVTVTYGGTPVLDGVCGSAAAGEWTCIVGPNGAGKTTLLRAVTGIVPFQGTVRFDGCDLAALGRRARARAIALVPQVPTLPPDMTVEAYVRLGRSPHLGYLGRESRNDHGMARRALARLDLLSFADRALGSLSGGERQRVVLARAVAQEARVLLLDEPTAALDLGRQRQVLDVVDELRRERALTVVAAMHDLTSVAAFADSVHLLSAGRVVAAGTVAQVMREDVLTRHFGPAVRVIESEGRLLVVPAARAAARRLAEVTSSTR